VTEVERVFDVEQIADSVVHLVDVCLVGYDALFCHGCTHINVCVCVCVHV